MMWGSFNSGVVQRQNDGLLIRVSVVRSHPPEPKAPFRMEILRGCQTSGGRAIGRQGKSWIQNPEAAMEKINRARQNFGYIRGFG